MDADDFTVIPAIDIQDGEVVQLVGGVRGTGKRYGDPATAARRWVAAGADSLHLVDLDGAFRGNRQNVDAIQAIRDAVTVPVQLGGGIRRQSDAEALLDSGIDRVILGTAALEEPELVRRLSTAYPGRIVVSLDASGGEVVVDGWQTGAGIAPDTAAARYESLGAGAILCTDVDVEGQLEGIRTDLFGAVIDSVDIPVIASGGVTSVDDLRTIRDIGAAAAVVGTALYEEKFTLAEARAALGQ